jgi:hypothetical protein
VADLKPSGDMPPHDLLLHYAKFAWACQRVSKSKDLSLKWTKVR